MGFFVALRRPTTWMSPPFTSMVIFTYVKSRDIHPREFEEKTGDKPKQKAYQLDIIEYMYNACVYVYCSKLYTDSIGDINMLLLFDTTLPCGICESTMIWHKYWEKLLIPSWSILVAHFFHLVWVGFSMIFPNDLSMICHFTHGFLCSTPSSNHLDVAALHIDGDFHLREVAWYPPQGVRRENRW